MRCGALGLVARRRLRAASVRRDPLLALLIAFVLETLSLVFVHLPPPISRPRARCVPRQRLLRMVRAVPLKMRSLSGAGTSSDSILDTARSIDPRRCG